MRSLLLTRDSGWCVFSPRLCSARYLWRKRLVVKCCLPASSSSLGPGVTDSEDTGDSEPPDREPPDSEPPDSEPDPLLDRDRLLAPSLGEQGRSLGGGGGVARDTGRERSSGEAWSAVTIVTAA